MGGVLIKRIFLSDMGDEQATANADDLCFEQSNREPYSFSLGLRRGIR